MPSRPVIGLSPLQRIAISPDELASRLNDSKTTLQDLIIENGNREYIANRGTYNLTGYVLFLFEYLGRRGTINEIIAASEDPKLTERSVLRPSQDQRNPLPGSGPQDPARQGVR